MNRRQRHLGRELALQWLFQIDMGHLPPDEVMTNLPEDLEEQPAIGEEGLEFARQLVHGVLATKSRIDAGIAKYATGWSLSRMAAVERNILRLALFEILEMTDIPPSVTVDEAVEVAKSFGSDESGKFVNGILGAYLRGERGEIEHA